MGPEQVKILVFFLIFCIVPIPVNIIGTSVKGQEIGHCFLDIVETSATVSTSPENCVLLIYTDNGGLESDTKVCQYTPFPVLPNPPVLLI